MSAVPHPTPPTGAAPELAFSVQGATAAKYTAVPTLTFALRIEREGGGLVRSVLLDAQVQIAARRRPYGEADQAWLVELFGTPDRWGTTLRTLLWTRTTLVVPPFTDVTEVELSIPCSYDLEVNASSYLSALSDGDVPLEFLFSGSVFYSGPGGMLQTIRLSWEKEAEYRLPVRTWREAMDRHFPGAAWLRVGRDSFDRLRTYKAANGLTSWEATIDRLVQEAG